MTCSTIEIQCGLARPCCESIAGTRRRAAEEAGRIADEVRFFGGDGLEPLAFPDWETLPYDRFSPCRDIVSERLATLYRLPGVEGGIVIASVTTLMQRLTPRSFP